MDRPHDARPVDATVSLAVIEAFTVATCTAFEELCQTVLAPGEQYLSPAEPGADCVTAEITLRRVVPGLLRLVFPRSVLETLVVRYLPDDALTSDLVEDAAGEFVNVIAGQAKTMLKGTRYHFNLSVPRVSSTVSQPNDEPELLVLPFDYDAGGFAVTVLLSPGETDG